MNFIVHAVLAVVVVLIGGVISARVAGDPGAPVAARYSFASATLIAQNWLFFAALYLRSRSAKRFDMTVAAETLVALGVFSLITGIVLAVMAAPNTHVVIGSSTLADFEPVLIPFGEGLFASALAPLLATLLRQIEVLKYAPQSGNEPREEEVDRLRRALKGNTEGFSEALSRIKTETESAGERVKAFSEVAKSIVEGLEGLAKKVKAEAASVEDALGSVAKDISTGGKKVSSAFSSTSTALDDFKTKAAASAGAAENVTARLTGLSTEAQKSASVLLRLQQIIDDVTDFIRPERK